MNRETKIAAVFLALVLAMVGISYYSYRLGYQTGKEIWRQAAEIVPASGEVIKL